MSDYPTFLQVGTEISAKFKGAFCEAKIKKAARCVRCRVVFKDNQVPSTFLDENVIRGSIRLGLSVEAPHPDTKQMISATIQQIKDCSTYTVVFDDGDEKVLRRSQMCLKGGRHFDESESLDVMPLTKPEQFGAPVRSKMNKKLKPNNTSDSDSDLSGPNSAVEKKSFERRSTRQTPIHSSPASSAANSSSSSQADFGRVVCVFEEAPLSTGSNKNGAQEKRRWYPAMIVSPGSQQGIKLKSRDEHLVRNFKDGKYQVVSRSSVQDFNIDKAKKNELASLKPAIEKAILYLEEDQLPVNWDREVLMGDARLSEDSSSEDSASDEEASSRKIVSEKKDRFVAQLYKYMDELGTPINKAPVLAQKDLDLYRLFESVRKLGGYNRVCLKNEWKTVLKKLKLDGLPGATAQAVKSAFNKYLSQFESLYRKKTSQSDDVSRRESQASKAASRFNDKMIENETKSKEEIVSRKPSAHKRTTAHKTSTDAAQKGSSDNESQIFAGKQPKSAEFPPEAEPSIEDQSETTIKRETEEFKIGQKLRVQYGFGTQRKIYMAKVVKVEGPDKYLVHYLGWNNRYDEIINSSRVVEILPEEPSDSEQPSGPPRFSKSHRGQKPSSMGRGERKMVPYARKRRSSGGSTHSLPFEPCGKMSPMAKKMKNLKNYSSKKEPSDVDSPKSTRTNGGGRRSNTSTPVPQTVSASAVDEPKQRRKIQKASDDDSNEDSEEMIAVTTRRSKRIRGEKPSESAPKNSSASAALKGEPSNEDTPEEAQEPVEQSPPVVDGQEGVAEPSMGEQLQAFDFLPASSVVEPETPKIEIVNEIKLIEDALIEEFTIEEKIVPILNVAQKEKITASQSSKRPAAGGSTRKQKAKRRKRNYSHMVTEYRKTKHTPKKECDSDNDASTKFDGSPKDVSSLHALRQKVQQEMDSDPNYKPFYMFNVIDENLKGEKKIQVLQQRLIDLKETYAQVKSEWTYLERKRKKHLEKKRKQSQRKRPSADSNEESRKISYDSNETASKTESANKTSSDA